ncbi:MAG TPA: protein kinase [Sandaracinaceae bacterium LLY-WYZ-13_1]|nr:protein kinase [Sandaracinaceae bacterium LLY-WYZ-13_1]
MPILTDEERVGTILADRYALSRILGSGGMGTVFEGTHRWTGRRVAVKLLKATLASEPLVRERFLREARAAASLEHAHAVDVLDMGETDDGTVFLVLELLEGRTLADLLAERGRLSVEETLGILAPVGSALSAAHARGFLHRDVKPENIFLSPAPDGAVVPKLLDFGLAKAVDGASSVKTATGHVLGTPHYMSPEQAAGKRDLGPATDVWSLGVVFFECLSGTLPFRGEGLTGVLLAIVGGPAPPLRSRAPEVDPAVADVLDRALSSEPERRIATMDAFLDALEEASASAGRTPSGRLAAALTPSGLGLPLPPTRGAEAGEGRVAVESTWHAAPAEDRAAHGPPDEGAADSVRDEAPGEEPARGPERPAAGRSAHDGDHDGDEPHRVVLSTGPSRWAWILGAGAIVGAVAGVAVWLVAPDGPPETEPVAPVEPVVAADGPTPERVAADDPGGVGSGREPGASDPRGTGAGAAAESSAGHEAGHGTGDVVGSGSGARHGSGAGNGSGAGDRSGADDGRVAGNGSRVGDGSGAGSDRGAEATAGDARGSDRAGRSATAARGARGRRGADSRRGREARSGAASEAPRHEVGIRTAWEEDPAPRDERPSGEDQGRPSVRGW